ncbi:MAG: peptide chain release factor N(5)-glutamine methyltransferase [Flavobacteriaceae bacterium]|nr:peptide chain release factor N(5)-glutamine methyltransferase [Flavobacteriaceae bacterium]
MTLIEFKNWFVLTLNKKYPRREIDFYFNQLMEHFTSINPIDLALKPDQKLQKIPLATLKKTTLELAEFKPLQYILGECLFLERTFKVNQQVMIPRPETEELVQWINEDYSSTKNIQVFDIGIGSGCIAISLAIENPTWIVEGCDAYDVVLKVANLNAKKLQAKTRFFKLDIFKHEAKKEDSKYHVIVSNPPYVTHCEKKEIQPNVLKWEPHSALFVPDENPLIFYRKIVAYGCDHLEPNGYLYLEINPKFHQEINDLLKSFNYIDIVFKKDRFDQIRMVKAAIN